MSPVVHRWEGEEEDSEISVPSTVHGEGGNRLFLQLNQVVYRCQPSGTRGCHAVCYGTGVDRDQQSSKAARLSCYVVKPHKVFLRSSVKELQQRQNRQIEV